jgi:hypothetical protein
MAEPSCLCFSILVQSRAGHGAEGAIGRLYVQADRLLVFADSNADLHLCAVLSPSPVKLAASVSSYAWNDSADVLAACSDGHLLVWFYPEAALSNRDLIDMTRDRKAVSFGISPTIEAFAGCRVTIRQRDGTRKAASISAHALKLFSLVQRARCDFWLSPCALYHSVYVGHDLSSSMLRIITHRSSGGGKN